MIVPSFFLIFVLYCKVCNQSVHLIFFMKVLDYIIVNQQAAHNQFHQLNTEKVKNKSAKVMFFCHSHYFFFFFNKNCF